MLRASQILDCIDIEFDLGQKSVIDIYGHLKCNHPVKDSIICRKFFFRKSSIFIAILTE